MPPVLWENPELISMNRLPMHAVPHDDRLELDGTWQFELLERADGEPSGSLARDPGAGRLDDAGHVRQAPLHERPDAVRRQSAARPRGQPDRDLRADVRAARIVGRPADRPPGRCGREPPRRPSQRRPGRTEQGFAPGRRVRPDRPRRRRDEHAPAAGHQVVRRHLHRGPGPVVARRHHPVGLPVRHGPRPPCRDQGDRRPRRRPPDRHSRVPRRGRVRRASTRSPAGPSRRPSARSATRSRPSGRRRWSPITGPTARAWPSAR